MQTVVVRYTKSDGTECCACGGNAVKSGRFYISDDIHEPESPDAPVAEPLCRQCFAEKGELDEFDQKQIITGRQKSRIEKYFAKHGRGGDCGWPRWLQEIIYGEVWWADGLQTTLCANRLDDGPNPLEWECRFCSLEMPKSEAEAMGGWLTVTYTRWWQGKPVELVVHYCSACRGGAVKEAIASRRTLHNPQPEELGFSSEEEAVEWLVVNRELDLTIGNLPELKEDAVYPWTPFKDCDPVNALA